MSIGSVLATPLVWLIRAYQRFVSPMRPPTCRYYPSCSAYAVTALQTYGPVRGLWMTVCRIGRCHPWAAGGVDHVPLRDRATGRPVPGTTGPRGLAAAGSDPEHDRPTAGRTPGDHPS